MPNHDGNLSLGGRKGDSEVYWQALREKKLILPKCNACGETYFYPRPFCPFCMSDDTGWIDASGRGTIYSFTVTARAPMFKVPAMVTLDEGPTMMTAIVAVDPTDIAIGQEVTIDFSEMPEGVVIPVFRPSGEYSPA